MTMTTSRPMRVPPRALQNRFRTTATAPTDSVGVIKISHDSVGVRLDPRDEVFSRKGDTARGEAAFTSLLRAFWKRGVDLQVDPHTREHAAIIAQWHWSATQHGLRYRVETGIILGVDVHPADRVAGIAGELPNQPYGVRARILVALATGARALMALGYSAPMDLRASTITAWAIDRYLARRASEDAADGHAYFAGHDYNRDANGWPSVDALAKSNWGVTDGDGVRLAQGVVRYAYNHHGHLVRGVVHGGINGQWMLLPDPTRARAWTTPDRYALWYGGAKQLFSWRDDRTPVRHRALDANGREARLVKEIRKALEAKQYRRAVVLSAELDRRFPTPRSEAP